MNIPQRVRLTPNQYSVANVVSSSIFYNTYAGAVGRIPRKSINSDREARGIR